MHGEALDAHKVVCRAQRSGHTVGRCVTCDLAGIADRVRAPEPDARGEKEAVAAFMDSHLHRGLIPGRKAAARPAQEDAAEFLTHLIERMEQEWYAPLPAASVLDSDRKANVINHLFAGGQVQLLTCEVCKHRSVQRVDDLRCLPLSLMPKAGETRRITRTASGATPGGNTKSVATLVDNYLAGERLSGPDMRREPCGSCGTQTVHVKRSIYASAPPVLVTQLLRFAYQKQPASARSGRRPPPEGVKLRAPVSVAPELRLPYLTPETTANLAAFAGPAADPTRKRLTSNLAVYRLAAVVAHHGDSIANGHYTTVARAYQGDGSRVWRVLNDDRRETTLSKSGEMSKHVEQTAYLAVYTYYEEAASSRTPRRESRGTPRPTHPARPTSSAGRRPSSRPGTTTPSPGEWLRAGRNNRLTPDRATARAGRARSGRARTPGRQRRAEHGTGGASSARSPPPRRS